MSSEKMVVYCPTRKPWAGRVRCRTFLKDNSIFNLIIKNTLWLHLSLDSGSWKCMLITGTEGSFPILQKKERQPFVTMYHLYSGSHEKENTIAAPWSVKT